MATQNWLGLTFLNVFLRCVGLCISLGLSHKQSLVALETRPQQGGKMKKLLALSLIGLFQVQTFALAESTPKGLETAPKALIVKVNKTTGETTTYEVSKTEQNLKDKKVFEKYIQTIETNPEAKIVNVVPELSAGDAMGQSEATPAWGCWTYHRPYFFGGWGGWGGGGFWNFPYYNYGFYNHGLLNYNFNYFAFGGAGWGNNFFYNYQPGFFCRPNFNCWF
jgi:hypothetical protein